MKKGCLNKLLNYALQLGHQSNSLKGIVVQYGSTFLILQLSEFYIKQHTISLLFITSTFDEETSLIQQLSSMKYKLGTSFDKLTIGCN